MKTKSPWEITHISHSYQKKESFNIWQERIASKINDIVSSELKNEFINEQNENFMFIPLHENNYEQRENIENDLLYNIPNLACFLYKNFWSNASDLIVSILKVYQTQTGLRFLNIDWLAKNSLPKRFENYATKNKIDEKYILYILWKDFTSKRYIKKNDEKKQETLDIYNERIKYLFSESSLFRKKIEKKIDMILQINEIEYLRKLIHSSFEKIAEIKTISDRKWIEFLISQGKKELKELQKELRDEKRKLQKTTNEIDKNKFLEEISKIEEEIVATKKDIWLSSLPLEELSDEITYIITPEEIKKFKDEWDKKRLLHDNLWIWYLEEEIILKILKELSRYSIEKSWNDKENAILKNFFKNKSLTCFSGSWCIASVLLKIWFNKDDIFIVNSFKWWNEYNHAFLIVRKSNGNYLKIDYGFKKVIELSPTKEIDNELIFLLNLWFNNVWYNQKDKKINFLDQLWRIYKLTDWIMLMYVMNLAHNFIDAGDLDNAMYYLNLVKWIDEKNQDLNEALWVIYDKLWEKEKSIFHFNKSLTVLSHYYLAKNYFKEKNYKKAELWFDYFINAWKKARWIDTALITSAVKLLDKIRKIQEKSKESAIWIWIEKQRDFLIKMCNHYIYREMDEYEKMAQEYINMPEVDRKRMLWLINNYADWYPLTQPVEIIMDLVKRERFWNTQIYKKLNIWKFKLII